MAVEFRVTFLTWIICLNTLKVILIFAKVTRGAVPVLNDFPISLLQKHIQVARQHPVCVVFRNEGEGNTLERILSDLWKGEDANYTHWELGGFPAYQVNEKILTRPREVPAIHCYLGKKLPHEYSGKPNKRPVQKWLMKLTEKFSSKLEEATEHGIAVSLEKYETVIVGFLSEHNHFEMEEMLSEVSDSWSNSKVLLMHPHSTESKNLSAMYGVDTVPSVIFLEKTGDRKAAIVKTKSLQSVLVTKHNIETYLTAKSIPAKKLNAKYFADETMKLTRHHRPMLVLFYNWWATNVIPYMSAYRRSILDFTEAGANLRYGLVEAFGDNLDILTRHIDPKLVRNFPLLILFKIKMEKTAVVGVDQIKFHGDRPTPNQLSLFLLENDVLNVDYQPWGSSCADEVSLSTEGPRGHMCSASAHNQTESFPVPPPKLKRIVKEKLKKLPYWHRQFETEELDKQLQKIGLIPVLRENVWHRIVEKSHAPNHPFISSSTWQGEVTKVTMIVYIIADCGSCTNNIPTFEDIFRAVNFIDGASMYLVNCTSDADVCRDQGVTGFPTIHAFRNLGWMEGNECFTKHTAQTVKYIRQDYHGVLREKPVMEWFVKAAGQSVTNIKLNSFSASEMTEDVTLVATLVPKSSKYLPVVPTHTRDYFYPYKCLRLACERMYGIVPCATQYSTSIPGKEFDQDSEKDMVVTKVVLYRRDGLEAQVMQLGQSLWDTFEQEEVTTSSRSFHRPHRYNLGKRTKCEDNHSVCTDILVEFTIDHARLPVSKLTMEKFHTKNEGFMLEDLPVLILFAHPANVTSEAPLLKELEAVGREFYSVLVVVTVDLRHFSAWANRVVPRGHRNAITDQNFVPLMYKYPRIAIVEWNNHHRAAFHPPLDTPASRTAGSSGPDTSDSPDTSSSSAPDSPTFSTLLDAEGNVPEHLTSAAIRGFVKRYLRNPDALMVETEHF